MILCIVMWDDLSIANVLFEHLLVGPKNVPVVFEFRDALTFTDHRNLEVIGEDNHLTRIRRDQRVFGTKR